MKKIINNLIITSICLFVIYIIAQILLNLFGLQFRAKVNVIWLGSSLLGFVVGIVLKSIITRNVKLFMAVIAASFMTMTALLSPYGIYIICAIDEIPHKEYVVEIDGYKFVGYENDAWDVFIYFYDYKNAVVSGNKIRFTANGAEIDENGNVVIFDDIREIYNLEDIYEYNRGYFTTDELTKADS